MHFTVRDYPWSSRHLYFHVLYRSQPSLVFTAFVHPCTLPFATMLGLHGICTSMYFTVRDHPWSSRHLCIHVLYRSRPSLVSTAFVLPCTLPFATILGLHGICTSMYFTVRDHPWSPRHLCIHVLYRSRPSLVSTAFVLPCTL